MDVRTPWTLGFGDVRKGTRVGLSVPSCRICALTLPQKAATALSVAYVFIPSFAHQIDRTVSPDRFYLERYGMGVAGIDDGGRWNTLVVSFTHAGSSPEA